MSFHETTVAVRNPSSAAKLTVSIQGQTPRKTKRTYDWTGDRAITTIRSKSIGSIGGGVITDERRFVLVADAPTTIEITSLDGKYDVEELKLVKYKDCSAWDDKTALESPKHRGSTYKLDADTRVSFRINLKDTWNGNTEGCYLNLANLGDANIQVIAQTEEEVWTQQPAKWLAPTPTGSIAPGATQQYRLSDTTRLVVESETESDLTLEIANTNPMHSLRLSTDKAAFNIAPSAGANSSNTAGGAGHSTAQISVRKGLPVTIAQMPL